VAYGDLNLDSPQGAQMFYSRVKNAARSVCASLDDRDLITKAAWQKCYDHAVGSAMSQVSGNAAVALNQVK
jgi:UrcA family protein